MGLFRLLFWLAMIAIFVWFGATVPLGRRPLFGHLHAIFATPEAQELGAGAREEAEKVADRVRHELAGDASTAPPPAPDRRPRDHLTDGDRRSLDKLVRDRSRQ